MISNLLRSLVFFVALSASLFLVYPSISFGADTVANDAQKPDMNAEVAAPASALTSETTDGAKLSKSRKAATKSVARGFRATHLMPLGVGEFMSGDYLWGTVVGGIQAAGLGVGIMYYLQAQDTITTGQSTVDSRAVESESYTDPTEKADFDAATDSYAAEMQTKYDQEFQMMQVGFGLFAAGWIGGITKALLSSGPTSPKKRKTKKSKPTSALIEDSETELEVEEWQARHVKPDWDLDIHPNLNAMRLDLSYHF